MNLYQKLLACGLIGISTLIGCNGKSSWPVYDFKLKQFIKRERGINKTVLNSLNNLEYKTKSMLNYYQGVENREQSWKFSSAEGSLRKLGYASIEETINISERNLELVEIVDKAKSVKEEYKSLKKLLIKCNKICENTEKGSLERVIKLCNTISRHIKPYKETPNAELIVDLIDSELGDCNDIASAYYALLNFYHIECNLIIGKMQKDSKFGLHAWIRVKTKEHSFELDPTWYEMFTPLERVREGCIKDEFKVYRK